eukprot:5814065-Pyramimonas_sp.AAC.1
MESRLVAVRGGGGRSASHKYSLGSQFVRPISYHNDHYIMTPYRTRTADSTLLAFYAGITRQEQAYSSICSTSRNIERPNTRLIRGLPHYLVSLVNSSMPISLMRSFAAANSRSATVLYPQSTAKPSSSI